MSEKNKKKLTLIGVTLISLLFVFGYLWSAYTTAGKKDLGVIAIYEQMQNVYANSIIETLEQKGLVIEKQKKDILEAIDKNMLRYKNDNNLMFKAISESAGLTIPSDLYKDLSISIEAGYRKFESTQKDKIDRVRNYQEFLNYSLKGTIAKAFGFPSEKAKFIMDNLITNEKTKETFSTGIMQKPKMFKE